MIESGLATTSKVSSGPWDATHQVPWTYVCSDSSGDHELIFSYNGQDLSPSDPALRFRGLREVGRIC